MKRKQRELDREKERLEQIAKRERERKAAEEAAAREERAREAKERKQMDKEHELVLSLRQVDEKKEEAEIIVELAEGPANLRHKLRIFRTP